MHQSIGTVSPEIQALMEKFGESLQRLDSVELIALLSIISVRLWDGCDDPGRRSYDSLIEVMNDMRFEPTRHTRQAVEILDQANLIELKSLFVSVTQLYANL